MSFRIDQLAVLNLATVGNSITAGSFVKSGGTSSQFLKADGSVDTNAYITGITSGMVTTALGYTPVPNTRNITINGVTQDLSVDRTWTISAGVSSVTGSGSGISVSPTTGAVVISNTGVTSNVAGTGISVSGATGAVTITNTGVTSIVAGTAITISGATGAVTINNAGVTSVNGNTGAITGIATTAQLAGYLPLSGGTITGTLAVNSDFSVNTNRFTVNAATGNTVAAGSFTANSIIKSGGTSSQFLKADGSIDSNSYITSASVGNGTLTLAVSGSGLSGSASFTANQSGSTTFTVTSNATTSATANTLVYRDASGHITGNYGFFAYINTSDNDETGITRFVIKNGDNYHRSATTTTAMTVIRGVASGTWGIDISGNSATTTNFRHLGTGVSYDNDRTTKVSGGLAVYSGYSTGANRPTTYDISAQFSVNGNMGMEIAADWISTSGPTLFARSLRDCCQNWSSWITLLTSLNYNSYSPTLTGGGASGTWSINITGNADTVDNFHASQSTVANNIVVRDANGYIFGNYINMTDDGNPGGGTSISSFITKQGDNYYRSVSPTNAMVSIRGVASGSWGINITGTAGSETLATVTGRGASTSSAVTLNNTLTVGGGSVYTYMWNDGSGTYLEAVGNTTATRKIRIQGNNGSGSYAQLFIDGGNNQVYTTVGGVTNFLVDGSVTYLRHNGSDKFWTGSDGTRNAGWLYMQNGGNGIHYPGYNSHFYMAGGAYWHMNPTEGLTYGALILYSNYNGTSGGSAYRKGYLYYDTNGFGLLGGGDANWAINVNSSTSKYVTIGGDQSNNAYNAVTGVRLMFGGGNSDAQGNYYIGTNLNNYGGNYNKLDLAWHTGIRIGAQTGYGGIRMYNDEDFTTLIFSVGEGDSNVRVTNNLYMGGNIVATQSWVNSQGFATGGPFLPLSGGTLTGALNAWSGIVSLNRINFTDTSGSQASDPYSVRWISESSARGAGLSWLEFQLNDDSNEEIRIYGNSCAGYGCGAISDNLYHRFRADGYAWHAGTAEAGSDFRAPIFYDSNDITFFGNFASTSRFNATVTNTSYFGVDTNKGYAQGWNTYDSSLHKISYITFDWDGNYNTYSNHGISSTDVNGSFSDSMSINSFNDINLRLDSNGNNGDSYVRFHNDTTGNNVFSWIGYNGSNYAASFARDIYVQGGTGGNFGNRLIVGGASTPYTLQDTNIRPTIYARGAYPVLTLDHTATGNTQHGPTIQFVFDGLSNRQWVIGCNGQGTFMDFGFSSSGYGNTDFNPHNGISGYNGNTIMRIIDNAVGIGGDWGNWGAGNPAYTLDVRGTIYSNTDMRAPIFYDSANTSYYCDPASTSVLNTISSYTIYNTSLGSGYYFTAGSWGWRHQTPSGYIEFGPANGSYAHIYTDRSSFYFNVNDLYANGNLVLTTGNYASYVIPIGGGWYGSGLPGSRWYGYSVSGGEFVLGNGLPNAGQVGVLIDGCYVAGENNGYWSMDGSNAWSSRRGWYWDGSYLNFTTNSPTSLFTTLRLANGFELQQGGSNYGQFNTWVHLPGFHGLYSAQNSAHFYPNNGTYGSWMMSGSRNGWQGIEFNSGSNGNITLMVYTNSNESGFHNNSYGWQIFWSGGALYAGRNTYGGNHSRVLQEDTWISSKYFGSDGYIYGVRFSDSNDSSYFLDPNGTSELNSITTGTRARWGEPRWWHNRQAETSDQNYWTGTNGWGTSYGNWDNAWRGGFSGWDIWGTGTAHPQGSGYIHAQGIVSGQHYANSDGSAAYGWMMVGAGDATANRYWLRGKWGGSTSGWVEMITTGNIGSQNVNYASQAGTASFAASAGNTSSISSAVGNSYTWTGIQYFQSNLGGYCGSLSGPPLQAYSTGNNSAFMSFHKGGYYAVNMGLDADSVLRIGGWSAAANRWQLDMSGNMTVAGDVTAYSDARVKENIETVEDALDKVLNLRGVYYNRTDSDDKRRKVGVIAQEILEVIPEVVGQDNDGMYNVSYGNIVGVLIEAIKEQQKQIDELKARLD